MINDRFPVADFWRNGFCIARNVLDRNEVDVLRTAAMGHANRDMFVLEPLRELMLDPRITDIAQEILKTRGLVYFGDSSPMIGDTDSGFHKDNADKNDPDAPDWRGDYPIIRFGLYTDDHVLNPGGLDLRIGSHQTCSVTSGRYVAARTLPGDLVIWNLRTSHSGGSILLRGGIGVNPASLFGKLLRRLPAGLVTRGELEERVALFWTFGVAGPHLDRYISYLKTRRYAVTRWQDACYEQVWLEQAAATGIRVRDVRAELAHECAIPLNDGHISLYY